MTHDEFLSFLRAQGWELISDEFWEDFNRLIFGKEGTEMIVQCLPPGATYFYPFVVKICELFGIEAPKDHIHSYYQHCKKNDPCHCGSGSKFKDCHGKTVP